ncbi:Hypothetical protein IALB_2465 [Ignavibacterium album JCM 16511]|uniref:Glycosyltransferase n=1 Tax=Ignavibacterium album (strain DSM 19864 / JCM 16511 / NBRC 101810 / Mat9-16) TaxID=945713 RepID=I0AMG1_IGNAJ|nr:hypothetical protein [Ignavibacterium album]AFH50168.1 Hypothetical protein IALB_2465 [Ignavibacterium album JCM 16511]
MIKKKERLIFISWTPQGRHTELFAKALSADLFFIPKNFTKTYGILLIIDYLLKTIKTCSIILKYRPTIVFVQNPPSFLPIIVVALSKIIKFKTAIDTHNGAFENPWIKIPLHKWSLKNADIVTIHNEILHQNLLSTGKFNGINFLVINSRLSDSLEVSNRNFENYFLIISSFSSDEPIQILLEGIELFLKNNSSFKFKVTGNYVRQIQIYKRFKTTKGIEFLGFIDDIYYLQLLSNAFGAISVSRRDDVQQFSLMECIGLGVPFISNLNKTNQLLFHNKMPLFELKPMDIANCISDFIKRKNELNENIYTLKSELLIKWEIDFNNLLSKLKINE